MCNQVFMIDKYENLENLITMELTTLNEKRDYYLNKLRMRKFKRYPEDRFAILALIVFIEREIMIKELNRDSLKPITKKPNYKPSVHMLPYVDSEFYV